MIVCPRCRLVAPPSHAYPDDCIAMLRAVVDEVVLERQNASCAMPMTDDEVWANGGQEVAD